MTEIFLSFHNNYILPHLDYCSVIWENCSSYLLIDILKLQEIAAWLILNKDYNTLSSELFSELERMSVHDKITYRWCGEVF